MKKAEYLKPAVAGLIIFTNIYPIDHFIQPAIICPVFNNQYPIQHIHLPHAERPENKFPNYLIKKPLITITGSTFNLNIENL